MSKYLVIGQTHRMVRTAPGTFCPDYTDFSTVFDAGDNKAAERKAREIENLCYGGRLYRVKLVLVKRLTREVMVGK